MDEVLKIRKELEKTVPKNDTKRALELLKCLESIPMTLDVLQKTHIGMAVNKIRKSVDNSEISSLSKSMVKKWKKLLSSSTSSNNNNQSANANSSSNNTNNINEPDTMQVSSTTSGNNTSTTCSNQIQSQDYPAQQAPPISSTNNERAKRPTPMQTEVPSTTSEVRLKCRQLLTDALKKPLPKELMQEPFLEEEILAARIEECIYQEFKCTDMKYKNRFRSRQSNLGDPKNPYLRLNVLRGDITPERIAKMTAEEMASDELKKEREKYTKEAINDHQMTLTSGTKTSEIKCPACKKYNVTYNQVQTRSADEPMTTFCYCNECGKRWKFC